VSDIIKPIAANDRAEKRNRPDPKGRLADKLAASIALIAALLAIIGSVIFFAGFVANDSYFGAVVSAFTFTALLGAFAVGPPLIIARIAWSAYKKGGTKKDAAWALALSLPWLVLSALLITYPPLPIWVSGLAFIASLLLTVWAAISLVIER